MAFIQNPLIVGPNAFLKVDTRYSQHFDQIRPQKCLPYINPMGTLLNCNNKRQTEITEQQEVKSINIIYEKLLIMVKQPWSICADTAN